MSIADKLQAINEAKIAIREAIIAKGVDVLTSDTFRSYADKILDITTGGGGGSGEVEQRGLSPDITKGLSFWIDGQCNTRDGVDHTIGHFEDLVFRGSYSSTVGHQEYIKGESTWVGDYLKLANYAYYPQVYAPILTFETLFKLDADAVARGSYGWLICSAYSSNGYALRLSDDNRVYLYGASAEQYSSPLPVDETPQYVAATLNTTTGDFKLIVKNTGETITGTITSVNTLPTRALNMGLGVIGNPNTTVTSGNLNKWEGIQMGMCRIWSRALSDEELETNYQEVKARFGF
jgi:hypothetical protein